MPEDTGRTRQKARTRRALLEAARRLMERGENPAVAAVADEAGISRATAYRYFADAEVLTLEAALDGEVLSPEAVLEGANDVRERVLRVQRYTFMLVRGAESRFRLFLARALDASVAGRGTPRGARRLAMYEAALAPIRERMDPEAHETLLCALAALSGIEAHVALRDVCGLDDARADAVTAAAAAALLDRFLPLVKGGGGGRQVPA